MGGDIVVRASLRVRVLRAPFDLLRDDFNGAQSDMGVLMFIGLNHCRYT